MIIFQDFYFICLIIKDGLLIKREEVEKEKNNIDNISNKNSFNNGSYYIYNYIKIYIKKS